VGLFPLPWVVLFCREVILLAVKLFLLPWGYFFLSWGYLFCRESFTFAVSLLPLPWGYSFCRELISFAVGLFLPWQLWASVKFCLMISLIYQLPVIQIRSQTEVKGISAKSRSVTKMGYDWNYQFGGQMQIHWERFTFIWVHDRGDRRGRIRDGWTRDESERNWHLEHKMAAWQHSTTRRNVASLS